MYSYDHDGSKVFNAERQQRSQEPIGGRQVLKNRIPANVVAFPEIAVQVTAWWENKPSLEIPIS